MLDALAGNEVSIVKAGNKSKVTLTADPALRAAVLLGLNCGAGNTDVANLECRHLDLKRGSLDYARGKTGIERRIPLWPETVEALNAAIAARPTPKDTADADCVLLTAAGERFVRVGEKSRTDYVSRQFGKLLRALGVNGRRGLGFYSLRHTLATIGLETADRDAVRAIMGHCETDVLSAYDETGPSDDRKRAVVEHVRAWLFELNGKR
jgi:integrase